MKRKEGNKYLVRFILKNELISARPVLLRFTSVTTVLDYIEDVIPWIYKENDFQIFSLNDKLKE